MLARTLPRARLRHHTTTHRLHCQIDSAACPPLVSYLVCCQCCCVRVKSLSRSHWRSAQLSSVQLQQLEALEPLRISGNGPHRTRREEKAPTRREVHMVHTHSHAGILPFSCASYLVRVCGVGVHEVGAARWQSRCRTSQAATSDQTRPRRPGSHSPRSTPRTSAHTHTHPLLPPLTVRAPCRPRARCRVRCSRICCCRIMRPRSVWRTRSSRRPPTTRTRHPTTALRSHSCTSRDTTRRTRRMSW